MSLDACVEDVDGENKDSYGDDEEEGEEEVSSDGTKYKIPDKLTNFFYPSSSRVADSQLSQVATSLDSAAIEIPDEPSGPQDVQDAV